jgi:hypothetical protein
MLEFICHFMEDLSQIPIQPQQGAIQSCIFCDLIYPKTKGNCNECNNSGSGFRSAQMMDRESSSRMILNSMNEIDLSDFHEIEEVKMKRERLISLLRDIVLYHFDISEALVTRIKDLDLEMISEN